MPYTSRLASFATLCLLGTATACGPMHVRPMPETVMHDPELEAQALRAVRHARDGLGLDAVKDSDQMLAAHIVSDFHPIQNELGIPVKRMVAITVETKRADGTCVWVNVVFSQKHMGGGQYGALYAEGMNERGGMECPGAAAGAGAGGATAAGGTAVATADPAPGGPAAAPARRGPSPDEVAAATKGLDDEQIDESVKLMGPKAAPKCKAYVREVCRRQQGPQSLTACQRYAQSMANVAATPNGATACKSMLDGMPPASH
jgi:hypothetical protein